jgi:hypothetical protein
MANEEHLARLKQGMAAWNAWRDKNHEIGPNLAKTEILAKYNTVNQVDRLHGGTKPAHAARE